MSSSEYNSKKLSLIDSLNAVETNLNRSSAEQYDEDFGGRRNERQRNDKFNQRPITRYRKCDSLFKKPNLPISRCLPTRKRPDYEKNPQKYKHYTLSDVTDLSDRMNSSAAFNFLREMEERKESNHDDTPEDSSNKIVFKNSKKLEPKHQTMTGEKQVKGNKFVMPEYVIGEKRQKSSKKIAGGSSSSSSKQKQLKLSHLAHDEDEDE
jgi:hypothetical protein